MINITATDDKLILAGVPSHLLGPLNSIPAASRRGNGVWWFPPSPFSYGRVTRKLTELGIDYVHDIACSRFERQLDWMFTGVSCLDPPFKTTTQPWNHQVRASGWLHDRTYAYLAMKMGTGKTLVAINEVLLRESKRTLILCPKTVVDVWLDEFERHTDADFVFAAPQKGTSEKKALYAEETYLDANRMRRPFVAIFNYETAWRDAVAAWIRGKHWEVIIADEGHRLKSAGSRVSRFAAKLWRCSDLRLLLSGTPLPNNQLDAYGQYRFLDPGVFGTNFARFRSRYAEVVTYKGFPEIAAWRNQEEFKKILSMTMFRVDEDVLDLPPLTHVRRPCTIPAAAKKVYDSLMRAFVADVEAGEVTAANALVRLLKFQQVTSGFITTDDGEEQHLHDEKRHVLEDIIEDVSGEPIVVFCRFRNDLAIVKEVAERAGRVYGEVSGSGNVLEGGRIPGHVDVLGVQIQAGGVGVNLNRARLCVFYSLGFSLADYEQAVARLHRGGQAHPVTVYHIVARDTVDEQIYAALAAKKKVVDSIMNYVKGRATREDAEVILADLARERKSMGMDS